MELAPSPVPVGAPFSEHLAPTASSNYLIEDSDEESLDISALRAQWDSKKSTTDIEQSLPGKYSISAAIEENEHAPLKSHFKVKDKDKSSKRHKSSRTQLLKSTGYKGAAAFLPGRDTCKVMLGIGVLVAICVTVIEFVVLRSAPKLNKQNCLIEGYQYFPLDTYGTEPTMDENITACQERCSSVKGCIHFTFLKGCHLQRRDDMAYLVQRHGAISGLPGCTHSAPGTFLSSKKIQSLR
eukprot:TRINITY_DN32195_c0_g1_i1.p1 TRINITY_DN32195_c0_g1~~TRINITY_DN32195_c0_g1_i1.p1  ORF type:complete len:267 (-),score=13.17 TRINITY_DN32195_c0_g1_i1:19-735(-)